MRQSIRTRKTGLFARLNTCSRSSRSAGPRSTTTSRGN